MFSAKVVIILAAVAICYGVPSAKFYIDRLKIDGGNAAKIEDYPFVASIQVCIFGSCIHTCGGVIIDNKWILTSSACAVESIKIVVGTADLQGDDKVLVDIDSLYVHPNAPINGTLPIVNDLALIKLSNSLTFNDKVQAAKLPKKGQEFTGKAVLIGFGDSETPKMNTLQAALDLALTSNDVCAKQLEDFFKDQQLLDNDSNVCTLSTTSNTCDTDLGSPLSQDGTVIATVSLFIQPCGSKGAPNVYTKLSTFVDWIDQTITENS
ncbi:unnamed protein product [Psylliodes chrysocephalus]|uniref:Peptidase S1 domain-containing protein n=1 Tax=Psylliodes chrysocephalus TaxID=3402493 RepID=A0A9P0CW42_9CUCU|nr:unnamed protein product [Psylliodes chrysocephala]